MKAMSPLFAKPQFIGFDERENLLVADGVLVPDNDEFFVVLYELSNVFTKQRKRRVCNDDIGPLQQSYSFMLRKSPSPLGV